MGGSTKMVGPQDIIKLLTLLKKIQFVRLDPRCVASLELHMTQTHLEFNS